MTERFWRRQVVLSVLVLSILASAPAWAAKAPGGATPQEVFDRLRAAAAAEDFGEMVACMNPASVAEMSQALYAGGLMMVGFMQMAPAMGEAVAEGLAEGADAGPEASAELEKMKTESKRLLGRFNELSRKYGLPELPESEEAAAEEDPMASLDDAGEVFAKIDHGAFIADMMGFMKELGEASGDDSGDNSGDNSSFAFPPGEIEELEIEGDKATAKLGEEPIQFAKIGGRWYVDMESAGL